MNTLPPSHSERATGIAAKLYQAKNAMRLLYGENFPAKVAEYQTYIRNCMDQDNLDALDAITKLVTRVQKLPGGNMAQTMLLAAYVEMVEPSVELPKDGE